MYAIGLVGPLVIISGVIAFVGDRLGRWMGKRRIIILGMRPRVTATVMTVLAGILITVFTILVMYSVSNYAKIALFQLSDLFEKQELLKLQNARLEQKVNILKGRVELVNNQLDGTQKDLVKRIGERDDAIEQWQAAAKKNALTLKQLVQSKQALSATNTQLKGVRLNLKGVQSKLLEAEEQVSNASEALKRQQELLKSSQEEIDKLENDIKAKEADLDRIETERDNLESEKIGLQIDRDKLAADRTRLEKEVSQLKSLRALLTSSLATVRLGKILYQTNEPIITEVIPGGLTKREAIGKIQEVVEEANEIATKRGAAADEAGKSILIVRLLDDQAYFEPEIIEAVAEDISQSKDFAIVRLVTRRNCVEGEQVVADFELYRNKLIFEKGKELTSKIIDVKEPAVGIFKQLLVMLTVDVNRAAAAGGMMPGPERKFGELKYDDLFEAVEKIKKNFQPVKVRVVTSEDIWTAGPLKVKFQVGEEKG